MELYDLFRVRVRVRYRFCIRVRVRVRLGFVELYDLMQSRIHAHNMHRREQKFIYSRSVQGQTHHAALGSIAWRHQEASEQAAAHLKCIISPTFCGPNLRLHPAVLCGLRLPVPPERKPIRVSVRIRRSLRV